MLLLEFMISSTGKIAMVTTSAHNLGYAAIVLR
jgi:hypothetical protein